MRGGFVIRMSALGLGAFLFFAQSVVGAEKGSLIKLGTLAPEGSTWTKTFNTVNNFNQESH